MLHKYMYMYLPAVYIHLSPSLSLSLSPLLPSHPSLTFVKVLLK
jgi:hypothetical protein